MTIFTDAIVALSLLEAMALTIIHRIQDLLAVPQPVRQCMNLQVYEKSMHLVCKHKALTGHRLWVPGSHWVHSCTEHCVCSFWLSVHLLGDLRQWSHQQLSVGSRDVCLIRDLFAPFAGTLRDLQAGLRYNAACFKKQRWWCCCAPCTLDTLFNTIDAPIDVDDHRRWALLNRQVIRTLVRMPLSLVAMVQVHSVFMDWGHGNMCVATVRSTVRGIVG